MSLSITWLGHSTFCSAAERQARRHRSVARQSELSAGVREARGAEAGRPDPRLARPQRSHRATSCRVARATGAPVVCIFELGLYLTEKGLQNVRDMGIGGTQEVAGVTITMTQAVHSGSIVDDGRIVYLGGAAGFVLRAPRHADDLLRRRHRALRRHEDHRRDLQAARSRSCRSAITTRWDRTRPRSPREWLGVRQVVPMHWGTFPLLTGTPADAEGAARRARDRGAGAEAGGDGEVDAEVPGSEVRELADSDCETSNRRTSEPRNPEPELGTVLISRSARCPRGR